MEIIIMIIIIIIAYLKCNILNS